MKTTVLVACALLSTACSSAPREAAAPRASSAPTTCFILREIGGPLRVRKGGDACARRLPPASTFKIPHALIALETGARTGPDDLERWDASKPTGNPAWDQDQTLATAIRRSVVWYFQRTAKRIGRERMTEQLARLRYGNQRIGDDITTFWLEGPLLISADEQADFMARFVRRDLAIEPSVVDAVDALLVQRPGTITRAVPVAVDVTWEPPATELYSKTGSTDFAGENVRWLVGHVKTRAKHYAFVSLVTSRQELSIEAITQAMHELRAAGLVR
jgi:beta-lactamase class D